jgi:hypothetical protein
MSQSQRQRKSLRNLLKSYISRPLIPPAGMVLDNVEILAPLTQDDLFLPILNGLKVQNISITVFDLNDASYAPIEHQIYQPHLQQQQQFKNFMFSQLKSIKISLSYQADGTDETELKHIDQIIMAHANATSKELEKVLKMVYIVLYYVFNEQTFDDKAKHCLSFLHALARRTTPHKSAHEPPGSINLARRATREQQLRVHFSEMLAISTAVIDVQRTYLLKEEHFMLLATKLAEEKARKLALQEQEQRPPNTAMFHASSSVNQASSTQTSIPSAPMIPNITLDTLHKQESSSTLKVPQAIQPAQSMQSEPMIPDTSTTLTSLDTLYKPDSSSTLKAISTPKPNAVNLAVQSAQSMHASKKPRIENKGEIVRLITRVMNVYNQYNNNEYKQIPNLLNLVELVNQRSIYISKNIQDNDDRFLLNELHAELTDLLNLDIDNYVKSKQEEYANLNKALATFRYCNNIVEIFCFIIKQLGYTLSNAVLTVIQHYYGIAQFSNVVISEGVAKSIDTIITDFIQDWFTFLSENKNLDITFATANVNRNANANANLTEALNKYLTDVERTINILETISQKSAELMNTSKGGSSKKKVLGRFRNIVLKKNKQYVLYQKELITMKKAATIEKSLLKQKAKLMAKKSGK